MTNTSVPHSLSPTVVNEAGTEEKQPRVPVKPKISILSVLNSHMLVYSKLDSPKKKKKKKDKKDWN